MSVPATYLTVILIWSTTPLAIKWSAEGAGFAFAVASRMAIGLAVAALILAVWHVGVPLHRRARMSYLAGGLTMFLAMILTYWAAQYIHSGLISVLFGISPLITGVFALVWLEEDALTRLKVAGMVLGVIGLGLTLHQWQALAAVRAR
jgi:drug/metabolite transporter (DMT)-like permease